MMDYDEEERKMQRWKVMERTGLQMERKRRKDRSKNLLTGESVRHLQTKLMTPQARF